MSTTKLLRICTLSGLVAAFALACSDSPTAFEQRLPEAGTPLFGAIDGANGLGACMGNDVLSYNALVPANQKSSWNTKPGTAIPNGNYCTAKEIYLANATVTHQIIGGEEVPVTGPITCPLGGTFEVRVAANIGQNAASRRTNLGVWIAQPGPGGEPAPDQAVDGTCNHYNLIPGEDGSVDLNGDQCGDMDSAVGELLDIDLGVLTLACEPNENFKVEVPSCIGWTVPGGDRQCPFDGSDALNFRMGTVPSSTSKCNCEPFELDITVELSALLEVRKEIDPTDDGGKFNLLIDGVTHASNVGHNGTTGAVQVTAGTNLDEGDTHSFAETAGDDTDLGHYDTTWECRDRGGAAGSRGEGTGPGPEDIFLEPDDDVVCTFTNVLKRASLTLYKTVINDDGGEATAADFQAYINGSPVDWEDTQSNLLPGPYTASEDVVTGYTAGPWTGDCNADGTITLAPGQDAECFIENDDQPATLTLIKHVVGGTASEDDFQARINGNAVPWGVAQSVGAGNHLASEDVFPGYEAGVWEGDCDEDGSVTLALGEDKTCEITNTFIPVEVDTETAFAMGTNAACFIPTFSQWGWTNGAIGGGEYTWPMYAGAADCDTSKGVYAGDVVVNYDAVAGTITVVFNLLPAFTLESYQVYAGSTPFPVKNGKSTVAPGQYYIEDPLTGNIFVIVHAVVGSAP